MSSCAAGRSEYIRRGIDMNVGLPGTGIGGMCYMLSALCMAFVEACRSVRTRDFTRWGTVARQALLALGMAAGMWATGWVLATLLAHSPFAMLALYDPGGGRITSGLFRTAT